MLPKIRSIRLYCICLAVLAFLAVNIGAAEAKLFRYAAHGSPKGIRADALKWWASELEKKSNGEIKIKFFWSGSLLKPGDAMEGIGMGTANIGGGWGIYHPSKTPLWTVADPPFSHADPYVGLKTMQTLYKTYEPMIAELANYNVKLLAPFGSGMTQFGTRKGVKPLLKPADAEGIKIRFAGGQWAKLWQDCGAVPVKLTQGEVYEGMMRGTVDATQSYFFILEAYKHWDVIADYSVVDAGQLCSYGIIVNLDDWKSLSPELQKIFTDVSDAFVDRYAQALIENRARIRKLSEEKGVIFHTLSADQRELWMQKAAPLMAQWAKDMDERGVAGTQTQLKFIELRDKYAADVAAHGYPWEK